MEDKQFVEEILRKVMEELKNSQVLNEEIIKPKLLVLSEEHKTCCHEILEHTGLTEHYQPECALTRGYDCRIEDYETIVLFSLSNTNLGKLTMGVGDTPYLALALNAILAGKKIYVPNEEVELFSCEASAPKAFYSMMFEKIEFLKSCGITFCNLEQLESVLVDKTARQTGNTVRESIKNPVSEQAGSKSQAQEVILQKPKDKNENVTIDKKVVTERDIKRAWEEGAITVYISNKAIISDLAKEYAKNRNILLKRSGL